MNFSRPYHSLALQNKMPRSFSSSSLYIQCCMHWRSTTYLGVCLGGHVQVFCCWGYTFFPPGCSSIKMKYMYMLFLVLLERVKREREFDFSGFENFPNIRIYSDFRKFCYKVKIARNRVSRVQCNPSNQIKCARNCHVIICNIKLKKKLADSTDFYYYYYY